MIIARPFDRGTTTQDSYRVNNRIRVPEVRVIGDDGGQLGIMATHEALRMAEEKGLDLVEVSPKAVPPVCRVMDYGKFKYEQSKSQAKAKKHQSTVTLKEIKFRPKTDDHDFDFKVRHIRRFLGEGNKAKLVIIFRGREIVHPETGQAMLKAVFEAVQDIATIEQNPMMEGRRMLMVLAPRVGVIRPVGPAAGAAPATSAPTAPRPAAEPGATAPSPVAAPDAVVAPAAVVAAAPAPAAAAAAAAAAPAAPAAAVAPAAPVAPAPVVAAAAAPASRAPARPAGPTVSSKSRK